MSDQTPAPTQNVTLRERLIPAVDTPGRARKAARQGAFAAFWVAISEMATGLLVHSQDQDWLTQEAFADEIERISVLVGYVLSTVVSGFCGWRAWKLRRWAMVAILAIVLAGFIARLARGSVLGFGVQIVLAAMAVNGARGAFAYHRLRNEASADVPGGD